MGWTRMWYISQPLPEYVYFVTCGEEYSSVACQPFWLMSIASTQTQTTLWAKTPPPKIYKKTSNLPYSIVIGREGANGETIYWRTPLLPPLQEDFPTFPRDISFLYQISNFGSDSNKFSPGRVPFISGDIVSFLFLKKKKPDWKRTVCWAVQWSGEGGELHWGVRELPPQFLPTSPNGNILGVKISSPVSPHLPWWKHPGCHSQVPMEIH